MPVETLESMIDDLCGMLKEVRVAKQDYDRKTKHVKESIEAKKNIIEAEVIKLGHSVTVGDLKVEYKPVISYKLRKEKKNE